MSYKIFKYLGMTEEDIQKVPPAVVFSIEMAERFEDAYKKVEDPVKKEAMARGLAGMYQLILTSLNAIRGIPQPVIDATEDARKKLPHDDDNPSNPEGPKPPKGNDPPPPQPPKPPKPDEPKPPKPETWVPKIAKAEQLINFDWEIPAKHIDTAVAAAWMRFDDDGDETIEIRRTFQGLHDEYSEEFEPNWNSPLKIGKNLKQEGESVTTGNSWASRYNTIFVGDIIVTDVYGSHEYGYVYYLNYGDEPMMKYVTDKGEVREFSAKELRNFSNLVLQDNPDAQFYIWQPYNADARTLPKPTTPKPPKPDKPKPEKPKKTKEKKDISLKDIKIDEIEF